MSVEAFAHPSIKRAKASVKKRRLVLPREPKFIGLDLVQRMVLAVVQKPELRDIVMLFLAA